MLKGELVDGLLCVHDLDCDLCLELGGVRLSPRHSQALLCVLVHTVRVLFDPVRPL